MRALRPLLLPFFVVACNAPNFTPPSLVNSVRILATAADTPYAAPGATVNMQVLAFDGRANKPQPMGISWVAQPCFNPPGDNYFACYAALEGSFGSGGDIGPLLKSGPRLSFEMPSDVIARHQGNRGGDPYGLAVVFTIACAGTVQYVRPPSDAPADTVPFGCFDSGGARLGPGDFIFAYSLVYSFAERTNANPVIERLTLGDAQVDPTMGLTVEHCSQSNITKCASTPLETVVPNSSDEVDPGNLDVNGNPLNEQIYVDYYLTAGKVDHDAMILFDPRAGRLSSTSDAFYPPQGTGDSLLWAVVHDNRGGVWWLEVPVHAQ
jgi:hypothetical protein